MAVGETIGRAFVRILADGSGLPQSIKDEVKGNEAAFESQGRKDFASYAEGRDKALEEKPTLRAVLGDIRKSAAEFDVAGQFAGEKIDDGLLRKMDVEFRKRFGPEVGERMSAELRKAIVNEQTLGAVREFAQRSGTEALKATEKILKEEKKAADEVEKAWRKSFDDINRDSDRMVASIRKDTEDLWQAVGFIARKAGEGFTEEFDKIARDFEKGAIRIRNSAKGTEGDISALSDVIGKAFGKGSRNNFVNFVGTVVGGLSNIIEKIPGLRSLLGPLANDFETMSNEGTGFFETVFSGGFASGVDTLGRAFVGFAGALVPFVVILSGLISLFAGLAGGIIAMASSIAFALSAGLGVFVGLLAPLAAGIGAVVLGLSGLDGSRVKNALSPVIDGFKQLKEAAGKELTDALVEIGPALGRAFKRVTPLIDAMIGSLGKLVGEFAEIFGSPAFKKFASQMADVLPHMTNQLGEIFKRFGRIAFGIFRGLIPITREFLGWLRPLLNDFAEWINSAKGQTAVKNFFREAGDSAKVVWDLIKQIGRALGLLASEGKGSGDTLISQLAGQFEDFANFLKNNPDAVKDWFGDAEDITNSVGDALLVVVDIFDKLDDPNTRDSLIAIFDIFNLIGEAVGPISDFANSGFGSAIASAMQTVIAPMSTVLDIANKIPGALDKVKGIFSDIGNAIGGFFSRLGDKFSPAGFAGLINAPAIAHAILGKLPNINLSDIFKVVGVIGKIIGSLPSPGEIIAKMAFDLVRIIQAGVSFARFLFDLLPSPTEIISKMVFDLSRIVSDVGALTSKVLDAFPSPSDIVDLFVGLGSQIADAIGDVVLHISFPPPPGGLSWGDIGNFIVAGTASGGVFDGAQTRLIGEAGPEAVVPLNRPLSQVDPAVRMLSAIAQGKFGPLGQMSGRRPIDVGGITVITPVEDPRAVATQVLNQLAATSYF